MTLAEFVKKASPGQAMVLKASQRFPVVVTGLQAGKTTLGAVWMCKGIYADYQAGIKGDYLIATPTLDILRQSTLPKFRELFPEDWGEWKAGDKVFKLKWGGNIWVRSTDEPDHLEGMTVRRAWFDEAGQMKSDAWTNVQGRLSIAKGPCLMTTTPYSMGWFYREVIKKAATYNDQRNPLAGPITDENIAIFNWKSTDNPAFPQDEYERMKISLPSALFERRYNGKFTQLEGLVYPDFKVCDPFVIPPEWFEFGGMDFGHTNPTAIIQIAEDPQEKIYYAHHLYYKAEETLARPAEFILNSRMREVNADPQSKQLIEELRQSYHCNMIKQAENNIALGIERVTALFRTGRLKIFNVPEMKPLIEELEEYHLPMPDKDGYVKEVPVAKNNHAVDALRYAFSKGRGKPIGSLDPLDTFKNSRRSVVLGGYTRSQIQTDSWTGY